jgi:deoxyribodipyrimidine photo-lyase
MSQTKCIFIFRRDLRLYDNTTLIYVLNKYDLVLPVFIFDYNQLHNSKNNFFIQAQNEAVADLNFYLKKKGSRLCCFYGKPHKVISYLIKNYQPNAVAFNNDYSIYSRERDTEIIKVCTSFSPSGEKGVKIEIIIKHDNLLSPGTPFDKRFGFFIKSIVAQPVVPNKAKNYDNQKFDRECPPFFSTSDTLSDKDSKLRTRKATIELLKKKVNNSYSHSFSPSFLPKGKNETGKNETGKNETGKKEWDVENSISVNLKLGLISVRELYKYGLEYKCVKLIKGALWREFFFGAWLYYSSSNKGNYRFYDERYGSIKWLNRESEIKALWSGKTGYPLVDASVRQLNKTGFMWNRGRLIVGFFSVKILRINPWLEKWGGQAYFSSKLIDCCYANNTGNWHWVSSDTLDASGQRFGKGWSGRPLNPEKLHPGDEDYIAAWGSKKKITPIIDWRKRWGEWRSITV